MADEDRYGDLVYIGDKVENGDFIIKCTKEYIDNEKSEFDEIGVIEKSFFKVYVWDSKNTLKQPLYEWAEQGNGQKVIVFRAKTKIRFIDIKKIEGNYNYILNSPKFELITETLK